MKYVFILFLLLNLGFVTAETAEGQFKLDNSPPEILSIVSSDELKVIAKDDNGVNDVILHGSATYKIFQNKSGELTSLKSGVLTLEKTEGSKLFYKSIIKLSDGEYVAEVNIKDRTDSTTKTKSFTYEKNDTASGNQITGNVAGTRSKNFFTNFINFLRGLFR